MRCLRVLSGLEDIDMEKTISSDLGVAIVWLLTVWQGRIVPEIPWIINAQEHRASHMVLVKPPMKSGDW